jgi:hypothetical protein
MVLSDFADVRPPAPPWRELVPQQASGFLTIYLSDDISPLPVRAVTLPGNNKSDPNLETGSYGLFSTCAHGMRASVVLNRLRYLFFLTRWEGQRVLTGYYGIRWYAAGPLRRKPPDFVLAADEVRFIYPGIRLRELPNEIQPIVSTRFRIYKRIEEFAAARLLEVLREQPDRTQDYLCEINRLELFSRYHTGFCYPSWKQRHSFSWDLGALYLREENKISEAPPEAAITSSPTDLWHCVACKKYTRNKALLKRCPECGAVASLESVSRN